VPVTELSSYDDGEEKYEVC